MFTNYPGFARDVLYPGRGTPLLLMVDASPEKFLDCARQNAAEARPDPSWWGNEAFTKPRQENMPNFLSVG